MEKAQSIFCATEQGPREYQEDRCVHMKYLNYNCECTILAVLDGHRGSTVVDVCAKNLISFFKLDKDELLEQSLCNLVSDLNVISNKYHEGSTLSVACLLKDQSKVSVAILGDSPVWILDKYGALHIGPEHNVRTNLVERENAISRGGSYEYGYIIKERYGIGLQMSRTLGDGDFEGVISREPEIFTVIEPAWMLIASDGVFNQKKEGLSYYREDVLEFAKSGALASDIIDWAKSNGLHDNATALVWKK